MKKRNKRRLPGIPSWMWWKLETDEEREDERKVAQAHAAATLGLLFVIALSCVVGVMVVIGGM